ncbi:MAG: hypothetical protein ACTSV5_00030 [Promethearchaeota archaeon]
MKALSSNSFLVRYGNQPPYTNILIDAGTTPTFMEIEREICASFFHNANSLDI